MRSLATQLVRLLPSAIDVRSDGDLLAGFLTDGIEADFAELVRRHGRLVWGACRRSLPNSADAEDAFQATFLVLVRRGRRLTSFSTIGPWLYRVAAWTARNLRRRNASRLAKQTALSDQVPAPSADCYLPLDIDAALLALPEKFRSPIVLCHLLGFSRADAAERLGCPEGTLSSWLSRGLAKLRSEFGGLDPAKLLGIAAVAVPTVLASSAVRAAVASRVLATAAVSSTVTQIVEGAIRMFWIKKATAMSVTVFAVFAFGVGVGLTGRQAEGIAGGQEKVAASPNDTPLAIADLDKEIAELQKKIDAAEEVHLHAMHGVNFVTKKIELTKSKKETPVAQLLDDLVILSRFKENASQAAEELKVLKDKLAKLKALKQSPFDPIQKPKEVDRSAILKEVNEIDAKIHELNKRSAELRAEVTKYEDEVARATRAAQKAASKREDALEALKAYETQIAGQRAELKAKQADLGKPLAAAANAGAYFELTVTGKQGSPYLLKETDANGKSIGTVTTGEGAMLQRLLARAEKDATAPKEIRVVVEPAAVLTGHVVTTLKACDSAGIRSVKFTGYVFQGGFAAPLKADQKGDVAGYKFYNGAERSPASLIAEVELGMRTH